MSANDHTTAHEEGHTGPIKTPTQLLWTVFYSFVIPVFAIIALVYFVTSAYKPGAGSDNSEKAVAQRLQKIGAVEIRDANRPLKSGEEVFNAQCAACHTSGAAGAPKLGDAGAWAPRFKIGFDTLVASALKGKGAMGAQGGGDFSDVEIARAVAYLANKSGGKFNEPAAPAAQAGADASAAAAPAAAVAVAAVAAETPAAAAPAPAKVANGEALYKQACLACHAAGVAGAPKLGDKAAWASRLKTGVDTMTASVIKGKGAMPPKGGSAASDADIRAAVEYMVATVK